MVYVPVINKYLNIILIMLNTLSSDIIYEIQQRLNTKELIYLSRTCWNLRNMFKNNLYRLSLDLQLYRNKITDAVLEHLKGIHAIYLWNCNKITDVGLEHLKGVHTINLWNCNKITDVGLEHLKGAHTVNLTGCKKITDVGLEHLKGVHTIYLWDCNKITDMGKDILRKANPQVIIYQ